MTVTAPREVVQQWVQAWNASDPEAVRVLAGTDFVRHDANSPEVVGPEALMQLVAAVVAAFLDLHFAVNQLVAEGEFVADHLTGTGTHRGEYLGVPPTGREVRLEVMDTYPSRTARWWSTGSWWTCSDCCSSAVSFARSTSRRPPEARSANGSGCPDRSGTLAPSAAQPSRGC